MFTAPLQCEKNLKMFKKKLSYVPSLCASTIVCLRKTGSIAVCIRYKM